MKSIYIAGPMSGKPDYGRRDFCAAESYLSAKGWIVVNPACLPIGLAPGAYMPICLAMVQAADAVVLLNGWGKSHGAWLEAEYAKTQGKTLIYGLEEVPDADAFEPVQRDRRA